MSNTSETDKFDDPVKLNIGCRDYTSSNKSIYRDVSWLNIDIEPQTGSNFLCQDAMAMPLSWANRFELIHAIHVLEHVNRNRRQEFVDACYTVMKPGGTCYIEVPDFRSVILLLAAAYINNDETKIHEWTTNIYGKQRDAGDAHCWGYSVEALTRLMSKAGFKNVERLTDVSDMISGHFQETPIILIRGVK